MWEVLERRRQRLARTAQCWCLPVLLLAATRVRVSVRRADSPELTSAKALALKLRRDCDGAKYPCIEWAVGIFRSEVGGATECVVTSNEGLRLHPLGCFLAAIEHGLLGADQLADNGFRDQLVWLQRSRPGDGRVRETAGAARLSSGRRWQ